MKAKLQPNISRSVKTLLSKILDKKAVVMIYPPLVSCHIEPSIKLRAKLEKMLDIISRSVGANILSKGAAGFLI